MARASIATWELLDPRTDTQSPQLVTGALHLAWQASALTDQNRVQEDIGCCVDDCF